MTNIEAVPRNNPVEHKKTLKTETNEPDKLNSELNNQNRVVNKWIAATTANGLAVVLNFYAAMNNDKDLNLQAINTILGAVCGALVLWDASKLLNEIRKKKQLIQQSENKGR